LNVLIEHETRYVYAAEVAESYTVLHIQPQSDTRQFCTRFELFVTPRARPRTYFDRFGNAVQHFAILPKHRFLSIRARSQVVTMPHTVVFPLEATRASLESDSASAEMWDYLAESQYAKMVPEVDEFSAEIGAPGDEIGPWVQSVSRAIYEGFSYEKNATSVRSTVVDSLRSRTGVCQDFAHVMIAVLRRANIPARYVSGYIIRGSEGDPVLGADASHAWCEAYLPPYGWMGFDPTNNLLIDEHYVRVAVGRDYGDVSPVRGVYKGPNSSDMSVNVAMEVLQSQSQQ